MKEIVYWDGPGWYASREDGAYENVHISTAWVGDDPDEQPQNTGRGNPHWYCSIKEIQEVNPEAIIECCRKAQGE